jgi:hypothetical protein
MQRLMKALVLCLPEGAAAFHPIVLVRRGLEGGEARGEVGWGGKG